MLGKCNLSKYNLDNKHAQYYAKILKLKAALLLFLILKTNLSILSFLTVIFTLRKFLNSKTYESYAT